MSLCIFSIVTPSFNQAQFIEETILSVIGQKGAFYIDYIILDGGSQDGSLDVIKKYADLTAQHNDYAEINGLKFYKNKNNSGISVRYYIGADNGHYDAINKGFARAVGDIYAWLNSDDKYFDGVFGRLAEVFKRFPELSWVTTNRPGHFYDDNQQTEVTKLGAISAQLYFDGLLTPGEKNMLSLGFIQQESTFWRKALWKKAGGIPPEYTLAGDFVLWGKFFLEAEICTVDFPIAMFRHHGRNRSLVQRDEYYKQAEAFRHSLKRASYRRGLFKSRLYLLPFMDSLTAYSYKQITEIDGQLSKRCERFLKRSKWQHP